MIINDVFLAKDILKSISEKRNLPTRVAYKLCYMLEKLDITLKFLETKRMEIFEEYGTHEGDNIVIPNEKIPEANKKYEELLNLEVEDAPNKVDISLDVDLDISPSEIKLLEPFINFVE